MIENGKYNPSLDLAFEIALYFNKTIEEIFTYEKETNYEKSRCNLEEIRKEKIKKEHNLNKHPKGSLKNHIE